VSTVFEEGPPLMMFSIFMNSLFGFRGFQCLFFFGSMYCFWLILCVWMRREQRGVKVRGGGGV